MSQSNLIYRFEEVVENPAGFSLNKRVKAVYRLEGFIHETFRNHPEHPIGRPHWTYVESGGKTTGIESEHSIDDLQRKLGGENASAVEIPSVRPVFRLYLGLTRRDGSCVDPALVFERLRGFVDSFTVSEAKGLIYGELERTLIITVACSGLDKVRAAAAELREYFDQEAVGIEHNASYERIKGGPRS